VGEILLIAADWQFRALVHAQLLEEGFQVRPVPSLEAALQDLILSGEQPRLTILDTKDLDLEAGAIADLLRLTGGASLVLCGDALSRSALRRAVLNRLTLDTAPVGRSARVLLRPFRVGDLVREVRRLWACLEGEAAASANIETVASADTE
jgi:DNA-binding response OmpR family regulator